MLLVAGNERFCINVSSISQVLFWKQFSLFESLMSLWKRMSIWGRSNGGCDLRNQPGQILIAGFGEMSLLANPRCCALYSC